MKQPEALRLADRLEAPLENANDFADQVAAELRRLHALNGELLEALRGLLDPATNEDGAWYRQAREAARAAIAKAEGK
jgi:hypothetical protein